jgi:hypothetical protein
MLRKALNKVIENAIQERTLKKAPGINDLEAMLLKKCS